MNNDKVHYKTPYWHRLLEHFETHNYFHNGLTIPFIIGAREYIEPQFSLLSVEELIDEFSKSSYHFNVLLCPQLGEYVFRITVADTYGYGRIENWVIQDDSFSGAAAVAEFIPELVDEYKQNIADGLYSRIPGKWVPFSPKDIQRIEEVMNAY